MSSSTQSGQSSSAADVSSSSPAAARLPCFHRASSIGSAGSARPHCAQDRASIAESILSLEAAGVEPLCVELLALEIDDDVRERDDEAFARFLDHSAFEPVRAALRMRRKNDL